MNADQLKDVIVKRREAKGWSQKQFAAILGKSPTAYNYIENNIARTNFKNLLEVCVALELNIQLVPIEHL